jgi:predicted PurR-regulated permease PerM
VARPSPLPGSSRLLPLIAFLLSVAALYFAKEVLIPFALAVLFSFLLAPAVKGLERCRLGRVASVAIVLVVALSLAAGIGWIVSNQLIDVISQLPSYKENIHNKVAAFQGPGGGALSKAANSVQELSKELSGTPAPATPVPPLPAKASRPAPAAVPSPRPVLVEVVEHPPQALQSLGNLLGPLLSPLITAFVVMVFTLFMLMKREDVRARLIRLIARRELNTVTQALDDAAQRVSRYLLTQFCINAMFGCIIAAGLYFIGVPNAVLWGVLAGLLRFIPYFGPLIGGALPFLLALAVFNGWTRPMLTLGFYLVVELTASNIVEPCLGGARTGISSLAILVAAVFWGTLWGPAGLMLSTPLTVCVLVLGRYVPQLEFLHVLLGDEPGLAPEAHFYQRLLAMDQTEAQDVVDNFLKERSPLDLYDLVLIPALSMAEEDRHKGALDEAKEIFIVQSISEMIAEIGERGTPAVAPETQDGETAGELAEPAIPPRRADLRVVCLPVSDQADEMTATMLSQVVERVGYPVVSLPVTSSPSDAVKEIAAISPQPGDVVCLSALPPFALLNARTMSKRLRSQFPDLKIVVGLWNFSGGGSAAGERFGKAFVDTVVTTLAEALDQIGKFADSIPQSQESDPSEGHTTLQAA